MADTTYEIALGVSGAAEVQAASAALTGLRAELATASSTSTSAAAAVAAAEAKYRELEIGADSAAKALEKVNVAAAANADKLAAAMAAGDEAKFWALAGAANDLAARQEALGAKSVAAASSLRVQASAIDALRTSAAAAAGAEQKLTNQIDAATKAEKKAQTAHDAAKKALPTGKVNELAEAFGKLPGPLGKIGQSVFGTASGLQKMGGAAGGSFAIIALGAAAAVAAIVGLGVGIFSITRQLVEWADKDKRLDKAQAKLQKNMAETFGGAVKIGGLLDGMDTLVALFDKSTASGRALSFITGLIFQPLIDGAAAAVPYIERAFIIAEIWALKAYIALKPYSGAIKAVAEGLAVLAAIIIGVVVVAAVMLALPFVIVVAVVLAVVAAIGALVDWLTGALPAAWAAVSSAASAAWEGIKAGAQAAVDWLFGLPATLAEIGSNMMSSLASAIAGAGGAIISAITGAVGGAIDAAKSLLGISSPSKVFAEIGMQTGAGMAGGVDASAGDVQSSLTTMADPTEASKGAQKAGAAGKGGSGASIIIQQMIIQGENAKELASDFMHQLEVLGLQLGGGEVPA